MGTSTLNDQGVATSQEKQQQSWEMGLGCKWFLSVMFTPLLQSRLHTQSVCRAENSLVADNVA